jgi:hypothetical protein
MHNQITQDDNRYSHGASGIEADDSLKPLRLAESHAIVRTKESEGAAQD